MQPFYLVAPIFNGYEQSIELTVYVWCNFASIQRMMNIIFTYILTEQIVTYSCNLGL